MSDDALCADPATSGSASAGHDGTAADAARARRRLTAESFRALTARLRNADESALFSATATPAAPLTLPSDESMPAVPSFQGDDADGTTLPVSHEAMNGGQETGSVAAEPDQTGAFGPFGTLPGELEAGEASEPTGQALPPELRDIFADTAAEEPVWAPEPVQSPSYDDAPDEPTMSEAPAAPAQASPFERAETWQEPPAGGTDGSAIAEAPEFDRSFEEMPVGRVPDVFEEIPAPEPGEEAEGPTGGEPAELMEPFSPALFEPAPGEPEDADAAPAPVEDDAAAIADDDHGQTAAEIAAPTETGLPDLTDLSVPVFTDQLEAAASATDSEAGSEIVARAVYGEDDAPLEAPEDAGPVVTAADEAGDAESHGVGALEPFAREPEDADAAPLPVGDDAAAIAGDDHAHAAADVNGPSGTDLPDLADLPVPVFTDQLETAASEADSEAGSEAAVPAVDGEDEAAFEVPEGTGPGVTAANYARDEYADDLEPIGPAAASSEAPAGAGKTDFDDDTPGSLLDMLRQLEGQFGSFADTVSNVGDGEAAFRAVDSTREPGPRPAAANAAAGPSGDGTTAADEATETGGRRGQPEDDLATILGSLSTRLESGAARSGDAPEVTSADRKGPDAPKAVIVPDEASGETARMLLDIMSMPSGSLQPQERSLAADTLLRLIARMPAKSVLALAERFSLMEEPPGLIIKELIAHPIEEVAALVLERCANVTDQDLLELIASGSENKRLMVARRRHVSSALVDALIAKGEASVYLNIVRNPGADISYDAFIELCELAKNLPSLQAPLATRANTPAPVAFELFWFLPSELRRYVLSRFLTDSETLTKILKITLAVDASAANDVTERKFPPRARIEELVGLIEEGLTPEASRLMANLSGICEACARRLIADPDGEPLTIVMKAMGATRALFAAAIERWQTSTSAMLRTDRSLDELNNLFDSMSFNKARVLLTYWDWAARKAGPYARHAA